MTEKSKEQLRIAIFNFFSQGLDSLETILLYDLTPEEIDELLVPEFAQHLANIAIRPKNMNTPSKEEHLKIQRQIEELTESLLQTIKDYDDT